jgi:hypothetical protein
VTAKIPFARLDAPDGWEVSTEVRIVEPAAPAIAAPLSAKKAPPKSRASITVSRYDADHPDPNAAMGRFLKALAAHAGAMKKVGEGPLAFADGGSGVHAIVTYDIEGRSVAQCHAFRIDDRVVTHLTATVEAFELDRITEDLIPILSTFRPR